MSLSTERFLPYSDPLGEIINNGAQQLYPLLKNIDIDRLRLTEHGRNYYLGSHHKRLFFSIETSAHLLYRALSKLNKLPGEVTVMDYGAGMGSLYLLAKTIGCKQVIYNDILQEWADNAQKMASATGIDVDTYIVGDIGTTMRELDKKDIKCDLITSRNVVEHIYKLEDFYGAIHRYQTQALVFSSTTANFLNPALNLQHVVYHRRIDKNYHEQRKTAIGQKFPSLGAEEAARLAKATRGYKENDLYAAVSDFLAKGTPIKKGYRYTNTCDMIYGVWAENLLTYGEHKRLAGMAGYECSIEPGFWDTHYPKKHMNLLGRTFNRAIRANKTLGYVLCPFIYVVAAPKN